MASGVIQFCVLIHGLSLAWSSQDYACLASPAVGLQAHITKLGFCLWVLGSNCGSRVCTASTLPNKTPPQLALSCVMKRVY